MSGEIVVPETPNWLKSLEEKREHRLKARLGHEAGAGAPCLKCGDKCPGLDLHFWRKACKICRCPKEEHDVHDDDIYGWAQFQLLGSKPNKIKTKIILPGKKDEVELEWAPKGQKETIDKYLKTLPAEALPVKGSQAAQERKQMLQKQIPIHDIDPSLCHDLNEEEVKQMEEYIAHIKKSSVGVGQIVNLSNVIKANLHNISPQEAHIIASRYSKGVPFSEIIKLQSGLAKSLEKLALNDPKNSKNKPSLPNMQPNKFEGYITEQDIQNPQVASKFKDISHPWYTDSSPNKNISQPQYAQGFKSGQLGGPQPKHPDEHPDYAINQKLFEGTNFDPSKTPSQFLGYSTPGYRPGQHVGPQFQGQYQDAHGLPYDKVFSGRGPENDVAFSSDVEKSKALESGDLGGYKQGLPYDKVSGGFRPGDTENIEEVHGTAPNYAQNLQGGKKFPQSEKYGFENPYFNRQLGEDSKSNKDATSTVPSVKPNLGRVPGYSPSKHDPHSDIQDPKAPKSVKDLMYSTYDPSKGPRPEDNEHSAKNQNIDPKAIGYDPNVIFNTYKHDPSVIKYENPPLLGKCDPAQPLGGNKIGSGPGILKKTEHGYIDPKTGNYVPGKGHFDFEHPKYDPKNPQSRYGSKYFDPETGKYIGGVDDNLGEGNDNPIIPVQGYFGPGHPNYDPKNPGQGYFGPGHPNYDPANPKQGYFGPGHPNYDSKNSGQRDFGPGHPNYDPKNPGQGYFAPGHPNYDPANPKQGYFGPGHPNYDPKNSGQRDFGPGHPNYDPKNPGQGYFGPGHPNYDPANPKQGYFGPGYPNYDPANPEQGYFGPGHPNYDPANPNQGYFGPGHPNYDPANREQGYFGPGHPNYDPANPKQGYFGPGHPNYDPKNPEQRHFGPGHPNYDPKNPGQGYFGPGHSNYDPKNPGQGYVGHEQTSYDPKNPGQEYFGTEHPSYGPEDPYGSGYFDPLTGKYISADDNSKGGNYDPRDPSTPYAGRNPSTGGSGNLGSNRPPNITGIDNFDPDKPEIGQYPAHRLGAGQGTFKKPLSQLHPGEINIPEDYLVPHLVNIGSIQDINCDIKTATTEMNPGFDKDSVYSDNGAEYSPESIREILNNIKLPDCHYCKKPFDENEYAVTVDRANVLFHAQCFKCAGCNQSLADNIYFYHKETDNVYCGRDYAKIKGYPRCTACDELIFTKEYCLAENSTFHLKHFCCFQCDIPLAGQDYTLEDEKPYCLPCYETSKAARCSTCQNVIKPDELGCQLNGVHFHAEDRCFRCIVCSRPLMGKKLLLRNEKLYCSHDCFNSVKM